MSRKTLTIILFTFVIIAFGCFIFLVISPSISNKTEYNNLLLDKFGSSDAKLGYDGYIITSKNNSLYLIDSKNDKVYDTPIISNWIGTLTDENVIVYSNNQNRTGICRFNPDTGRVYNDTPILTDEDVLRIDPVITKNNGYYYLCLTKIEGNVNRNSTDIESGTYSIEFYRSDDLKEWNYLTTIYQNNRNLEDVKFKQGGDNLGIIFEEEYFDKSSSLIYYSESSDNGRTWTRPAVLIANGYDNEPAAIINYNKKYYLFFSSDINRIGQSYNASLAYCSTYSPDLKLISQTQVSLEEENSILLYDVLFEGSNGIFLYAHDYNGDDDLVLNIDKLSTFLE